MEAIFDASSNLDQFKSQLTDLAITCYVRENFKESLEDMKVFYLQKIFARDFSN